MYPFTIYIVKILIKIKLFLKLFHIHNIFTILAIDFYRKNRQFFRKVIKFLLEPKLNKGIDYKRSVRSWRKRNSSVPLASITNSATANRSSPKFSA